MAAVEEVDWEVPDEGRVDDVFVVFVVLVNDFAAGNDAAKIGLILGAAPMTNALPVLRVAPPTIVVERTEEEVGTEEDDEDDDADTFLFEFVSLASLEVVVGCG